MLILLLCCFKSDKKRGEKNDSKKGKSSGELFKSVEI